MEPKPDPCMNTASQKLGAIATAAYSWRAPSPPHISIPPAPEDGELMLPAFTGTGLENEEHDILRRLTQGSPVSVKEKEWHYEWRRNAQQMLPFLYLGPSSAARDIAALQRDGITMLLVIRNTQTALARMLSGEKVAKQLGIQASAVDVEGNQELIAAFPQAIKVINNHLITMYQQGALGKVLVFCESGNERSATVVAAYIMAMYDIDLIGTMQYVQTQRFCVAVDDPLKHLLFNFQEILQANKHVLASLPVARPETRSAGKRGRDEINGDNDIDMDDDQADDLERFGDRAFAPFY